MTGNAAAIDTPPRSLRVREFFLARQPILNRQQELFAYELLFRNAETGPAEITSDLSATASVIAHAAQLGLEKVIGDARGFLNVDAAVLMSDIFHFLPRERVVLEIVETVKATPEVLARIAELRADGFTFALDDVIADTEDVQLLLPHIDIVKFDLRDMPLSALLKLTPQFRAIGKQLLAEKVESAEQFQVCLDLGFDYFQGYHFARPSVLSGRKLSPSQMAVMQLLSLVQSDADDAAIERAIKQDVALGINLLRLVNTPAVGMRHRITSLAQALMVLGRVQLQRWLQIMLYAEPCKKGRSMTPLLTLAATRGKLMELLAERLHPERRDVADTAFTVGIMSLMDTLFGVSMENILEQVPVVDDVAGALLSRRGFHGELLKLAEALEHIDEDGALLGPMLERFGMSADELYQIEMDAYAWSDNIARAAQQ